MGDIIRPHLRQLAPNDSRRELSIASPADSVISEPRDPRAAKPKRVVVHVACLGCRRLRIKCDGTRPVCTPCSKREDICEYDVEANTTRTSALKRKNENLELEIDQLKELYRSIRERPEYEAAELFRRIRVTEDPLDIHKQLTAVNILMDAARSTSSQVSEDGRDETSSGLRGEGRDEGMTMDHRLHQRRR